MEQQNSPKTIQLTNEQKETLRELVAALFKDGDKPIELSESQLLILAAILFPEYNRVVIGTTTQFGKSLVIGLGTLIAAARNDKPTRIKVIAPSKEQAKIIMNYALSHVGDSKAVYSGLMEGNKILKKKTEFSKSRLAWVHGSDLSVVTADAGKNVDDINKAGSSVMGFGGDVIIIDEAALIPKLIMDKLLRMLGANPNSKLILIGNPFNKGYFYKASKSKRFHKIWVDYKQAIAEGRLTQEFIDEMREDMDPRLFRILYEVKFVLGTEDSFINIDLIEGSAKIVAERLKNDPEFAKWQSQQPKKVGVDVARFGSDFSTIVIRQGALILYSKKYKFDTMALVGELQNLQKQFEFDWEDVAVDSVGVGGGPIDRLSELAYDVVEASNAAAPTDAEVYFNFGAQLWGNVNEALLQGALAISDSEMTEQLSNRKYEYRARKSGAVLKLESKDQMKRRGVKSPDLADALSLTFVESGNPYLTFFKGSK